MRLARRPSSVPGPPSHASAPTRWLIFNTVGLMGMVVQLITLTALREVFHLGYVAATALAVEMAILHNFVWHERWTWRDRIDAGHRWRRFTSFNVAAAALAIPGNAVFTVLYAVQLNLHYLLANVLAVATCSLLTFLATDRLVFARAAAPRARRRSRHVGATPCPHQRNRYDEH